MEVMIDPQTIITGAALLSSMGAIGGVILWCVKFVQRNDRQDKSIADVKKELTLLCYGVKACLQGLKEQGCDGPVSEALEKLDKHLNQAAHGGEGNS